MKGDLKNRSSVKEEAREDIRVTSWLVEAESWTVESNCLSPESNCLSPILNRSAGRAQTLGLSWNVKRHTKHAQYN